MAHRTLNERVQKHRDALRAQGLRPVQIWVPDTRAEGFADECARQVTQAAVADRADPEIMGFVDAALDDLVELRRLELRRGDVVTVALSGAFGKPRPAVVIQSDLFANHTTVTMLPVTSTVTAASPLFRLRLVPSVDNGLRTPSDVMVDRTMSVRPNKIGGTIGRLNDADMLRINRALALFLAIA